MQTQREHLQSLVIDLIITDFTDVNLMVWKVQSYLTKVKIHAVTEVENLAKQVLIHQHEKIWKKIKQDLFKPKH